MAFLGANPVRLRIVMDDKLLERVSHFSYLGCDNTYGYDKHTDNKLSKFAHICGTINKHLKNKTQKCAQLNSIKPWRLHSYSMAANPG